MFYPEKIRSIRKSDKVLEVGPGATPHPRADAFLEYDFSSDAEAISQRGSIAKPPEFKARPVTRYQGPRFPFGDASFDYVIASHVIEHVADPENFMAEICRVGGGRGYIEFPLPTYDYLYDYDVHLHFLWWDETAKCIRYVAKKDVGLSTFSSITDELRRSFSLGWDDLVARNQEHFFFGLDYVEPIRALPQRTLAGYSRTFAGSGNTFGRRIGRRVDRILEKRRPGKRPVK
jgi:SAM-dependent methyltransferase